MGKSWNREWSDNSRHMVMLLTVQNIENFRCLIFVTKGVQALSKGILKLCDKRMKFCYFNSGCFNKNLDKTDNSVNHWCVKTVICISIVWMHVVYFQLCNWSVDTQFEPVLCVSTWWERQLPRVWGHYTPRVLGNCGLHILQVCCSLSSSMCAEC